MLQAYEKLLKESEENKSSNILKDEVYAYLACCQFFMGMYAESKETAEKG